MAVIGDDYLAIGEFHLIARAPAHGLCSGDHPGWLTLRAEQQVTRPHLAHRRPPGWGRERGVKRERLAYGRPGRDDDHLACVQSVGERVQVGEPGGDAGDATAVS